MLSPERSNVMPKALDRRWPMALLVGMALHAGPAVAQPPPVSSAVAVPFGAGSPVNYRVGRRIGWPAPRLGVGYSSTAQEGMARGMADVIRSRGDAAVSAAQAATQAEQARRGYLENRKFAAQNYLEIRSMRKAYNAERLAEKREKMLAYHKSREILPLTDEELDPTTGDVQWPVALTHPNHSEGRQEVEALLAKRAKYGVLDGGDHIRLSRLLNSWVNHVSDHSSDYAASDISEAVRFIRRLQLVIKSDYS
ncbi:MAG: hypothetical protein AAF745_03005 [Planctomycetota bacterium]